MFRNFIAVALRNISRHKGYSFINIFGLSLGLACAFFIIIWIQDEVSTDRFHEHGERTFAVMRHSVFGGQKSTTRSMPEPLARALADDYPEVENSILLSWDTPMLLSRGDKAFRLGGRWAGKDFFEVFSFPLIKGDPQTVLDVPESVVLSTSTAEQLFGSDWRRRTDVIGSTIRVDNRVDMTVTGVFEDVPTNSSLQFEYVLPMEEFVRRNNWLDSWSNNGLRIYARLHEHVDVNAFNAKIKDVIDEHVHSYESDVFLYPIKDVYLKSKFEDGQLVGGRIEYVRSFGLVAFLIIVIASINFMNLATARSAQRAREIGVRKTVGASRGSLARQFLGESVIKAGIAFVLSIGAMAALIPAFNQLTGKTVSILNLNPVLWPVFFGIALLTGLLAGTYPALYLSSFSVTGVFDRRRSVAGKGSGLRKGLVVVQFAMSIVLIVGTVTIYRQLDYIRSKDLGINRENVVMVRLEGGIREQYDAFKHQLLQVPGITSASRSNNNPLGINNDTIGVEWNGKDPDDNTLFWNAAVGYDFVQTMGITMAAGRTFSPEYGADSSNYIINWEAAEAMGMEDPVGRQISFWDREGTIIGVMEDFHMTSMYYEIKPVIFRLRPDNTRLLFVRIAGSETAEALAGLERVYKHFNPEYPLNARFLDAEFEESYRSETVIGSLANIFAIVAIIIACLGLFGLASYTAQRRTREIGIRKALGATVPHVVALLSREFLLLVAGAFVVAAPVAYVVMNDWLQKFAYHTELGIGLFLAAGFMTLIIACLTVSYQSIRSALANPVDSLRSE